MAIKKKLIASLTILAVWMVIAVLSTGQYFIQNAYADHTNSKKAEPLIGLWLYTIIWALFTPLILWLAFLFPLGRSNWLLQAVVHFVALTLISLLHSVIELMAIGLISGHSSPFQMMRSLIFTFTIAGFYPKLVVYFVILVVGHAILFYRSLRKKELHAAQLSHSLTLSQLQNLQARVRPHFLFNTLNSINLLALNKDMELVREMITRLGKLLRLSMQTEREQFVSLQQEIEFLDCYLGIEEIRFKDRLRVTKKIDPEAMSAAVPALILQSIVENAIRHGLSGRIDAGFIGIDISQNNERLVIRISDDGPGLPEGWDMATSCGTGLKTTLERLEILYPDSYSFELHNRAEGGAVAELIIPLTEFNNRGETIGTDKDNYS